MAGDVINKDALGVLQSFRPYLGLNGSSCVSVLENLLEVMNGEPVQKMMGVLSKMESRDPYEVKDVRSVGNTNPFSLFLILILLLMADADAQAPLQDLLPAEAAASAKQS